MNALIDISGQRFGKLVVLRREPKTDRRTRWICACDCGKDTSAVGDDLKRGTTTSCGCKHFGERPPRVNLVGSKFGMVQVVSYDGRHGIPGGSFWNCACDCGKEFVARGHHLRDGDTRSCGCQIRVGLLKSNVTHGKCKTPEYRVWSGMLTRCYNKKEKAYKYYGAKGVTVCARWRDEGGFENFLADMGLRPSKGYWIDRKKNYLGYSPTNCKWTLFIDQVENRSTTIWVQVDGQRMSLRRACRTLGLNYGTIRGRMFKQGMSFSRAARISNGRLVSPQANGR